MNTEFIKKENHSNPRNIILVRSIKWIALKNHLPIKIDGSLIVNQLLTLLPQM